MGFVRWAPFARVEVVDCDALVFPVATLLEIGVVGPAHAEHLGLAVAHPDQMAPVECSDAVVLVQPHPDERGHGQHIDVVEELCVVAAAVDVDLVTGVVGRGDVDGAEVHTGRGNVACRILLVPNW